MAAGRTVELCLPSPIPARAWQEGHGQAFVVTWPNIITYFHTYPGHQIAGVTQSSYGTELLKN